MLHRSSVIVFGIAATALTVIASSAMYFFWYMSPFEQCVRSARALEIAQRAAQPDLSKVEKTITPQSVEAAIANAEAAGDTRAAESLRGLLAKENARVAGTEERAVLGCMTAQR